MYFSIIVTFITFTIIQPCAEISTVRRSIADTIAFHSRFRSVTGCVVVWGFPLSGNASDYHAGTLYSLQTNITIEYIDRYEKNINFKKTA